MNTVIATIACVWDSDCATFCEHVVLCMPFSQISCCQPTLGASFAAIRNLLFGSLIAAAVDALLLRIFGVNVVAIAFAIPLFSFLFIYFKPPPVAQKV